MAIRSEVFLREDIAAVLQAGALANDDPGFRAGLAYVAIAFHISPADLAPVVGPRVICAKADEADEAGLVLDDAMRTAARLLEVIP